MISIKNLTYKVENNLTILDNLSLDLKSETVNCLLGPSGCGKTTLIKHILGLIASDSITVDGKKPVEMLSQIGYMGQQDAHYEELSAQQNMEFFAKVCGATKEKIKELLELTELYDVRKRKVQHFSGGMKRRLSLAGALLNSPKYLILDEPTVGIDPLLREKFWNYFIELKNKFGTNILLSTHVMNDIERSDNVTIIKDGTILENDSVVNILQKNRKNSEDNFEKVYLELSRENGHLSRIKNL